MSNERKSITIDSASLIGGGGGGGGGIGGGSKRRSRRSGSGSSDRNERRIRPSSIVQPSTLKKTLLERIKQHQRTRERSRNQDQAGGSDGTVTAAAAAAAAAGPDQVGGGGGAKTDENFTQSMDFLRKLALKRREQQQLTQKRRNTDIPKNDAKTPEAKMLNDFSNTLKNGEILTNTGLLGLPVVPTLSSAIPTPTPSLGLGMMTPSLNLFDMTSPNQTPEIPSPPKITDLADIYNNTFASGSSSAAAAAGTADAAAAPAASSETPLHIPEKPEDYLPSIFIKEDPPHGCLKNGTKPTFREWATKMLHKPVDAIKNMFGGGDGDSTPQSQQEQSGGGSGGSGGSSGGSAVSNGLNGASSGIDPGQVAGMRVKIRKTKKKRFRIGKHDDVVGVLLKNKQTQRHIQNQHLTLKQKTIGEIRKYLYDHHLLKIGSNAPPDVLRRMYEDSILTGDVKNTNDGVMLHNFMSGGGGE
jgi:hypothetical protein